MDQALAILGSDSFLNLLALLIATAWSALQAKGVLTERRLGRYWKVVKAVETGVTQTYYEFTQAIKKSRDEDGKLTLDDVKEARRRALSFASQTLRTDGISLYEEISKEQLGVLIETIVQRLKLGQPLPSEQI